ncbi:type II toxin-antitoxin system VapC family toxin [Pseudonocardia nigra]|uniref:type II toxin-antitoxin system VapC family toxin n=1 Tax=Pseudonocardia nigra TaxID=1921578 RepID=UPI001C5EA598|nr:PIN domain nuclease [Pseudonocardia nigra]
MDLIDTSAWVEYLRRTGSRANLEVRRLLHEEPAAVAVTEPVVMELLAGVPPGRALDQVEKLTSGLRTLPLDPHLDFRDAAAAFRAVRSRGHTVRSIVDCLIAAAAIRSGATLVHCDRDFDVLAAALPDLRVRSLV